MRLNIPYALSAAVAASVIITGCSHKQDQTTKGTLRVETTVVSNSNVSTGRTYSGIIEESKGTVLSFKIPGTISNIYVSEGQRVSKGQLIAEMDAASLQSNLQIAQAAVATAQDAYNRMKKLHDASAIPEMKWVEVENTLKSAQSAEQIARNALSDARIYAPISGYLSQKYVDAGSTVAPTVPVVKIVEISPLKINISVSENEIGAINSSTAADVTVEAAGNAHLTARFSEKGIAADPLSRSYSVKFITDNPDGKILPGMLCSVNISSDDTVSAIVLPIDAVMLGANDRCYVWTVENGKAKRRDIKLGNYTADGVVIADGLNNGDVVIVKGQQKVSQDLDVQPIND